MQTPNDKNQSLLTEGLYFINEIMILSDKWTKNSLPESPASVLSQKIPSPNVAQPGYGKERIKLYREAQYLMVAFVDEFFLHLLGNDKVKTVWLSHLLEYQQFYSRFAGQRVFENLDALLKKADPRTRGLAQLYLIVLTLGFKGKYRNQDDGGQLDHYRQALSDFIGDEYAYQPPERLFPAAYPQPATKPSSKNDQESWVLLLGETGAGKSTLLTNTQLDKKPWQRDAQKLLKKCEAWFFEPEKRIVLDISGECVLQPDEPPSSDEEGWHKILGSLRKHSKQIGGVVLTIPCSDLLSPQQNVDPLLTKKAEYLFNKLRQTQHKLCRRFPVYILVTQSEQLTGFTSFCTVFENHLQEIFGWSNSEPPDTLYKTTWPDIAFQEIYQRINELEKKVVLSGQYSIPVGFLLFPHQFRPVFNKLQIYLDCLFNKPYNKSFFLRGIYFCGDVVTHTITNPRETDDETGIKGVRQTHRKIVFLNHLFKSKIFPETDLARSFSRALCKPARIWWIIGFLLVLAIIVAMLY